MRKLLADIIKKQLSKPCGLVFVSCDTSYNQPTKLKVREVETGKEYTFIQSSIYWHTYPELKELKWDGSLSRKLDKILKHYEMGFYKLKKTIYEMS